MTKYSKLFGLMALFVLLCLFCEIHCRELSNGLDGAVLAVQPTDSEMDSFVNANHLMDQEWQSVEVDDDDGDDDDDDDDDDNDIPLNSNGLKLTPFQQAVEKRDLAKMRELYKNDPHCLDDYSRLQLGNPYKSLDELIKKEDMEYVEDFIRRAINLEEPDAEGRFPLRYAIEHKKLKLVKFMVEHGAPVNLPEKYKRVSASLIYDAVESQDLAILKYLVGKGAKLPEKSDWVHLLRIMQDNMEMFQYLLSMYPVDTVHRQGGTALHHIGNAEAVKALLAAGANPNAVDKEGWTPLDYAIDRDDYQKAKLLLEHNVNRKGRHLLHLAALNGDLEWVKKLVEEGEDVNAFFGWQERTILFDLFSEIGQLRNKIQKKLQKKELKPQAIQRLKEHEKSIQTNEAIAGYLLEHGADVTLGQKDRRGMDNLGRSSLYVIAAHGSIGFLKNAMKTVDATKIRDLYARDLIVGAAHVGNMENLVFLLTEIDVAKIGRNILDDAMIAAVNHGRLDIVKLLVAHGASVHAARFEEVSLPLERKTILQIAAGKNHTDILSYLLDNGAVIDNARGLSPLLPASKKGNLEAVQLLVEHGAAVNVQDTESNFTPLMLACLSESPETVDYLLRHGADIHAKDNYGHELMYFAANAGNVEIAKLLLAAGADFDAKNDKPVVVAAGLGNLAVFKLLLERYEGDARQAVLDMALKNAIGDFNKIPVVRFILELDCEKTPEAMEDVPKTLLEAVKKSDGAAVMKFVEDGADVNVMDADGNTPLDLMLMQQAEEWKSEDWLDVVHFLMKHDAKLHVARPTLFTTRFGMLLKDETIVKYMLKNGADVNEKTQFPASPSWSGDDKAPTPIYHFMGMESLPSLKLILEAGADVNYHEKDVKTPLRYLMDNYRTILSDVVKCLLDHGADINIDMPIASAVQKKRYGAASFILDHCKTVAVNREHVEAMLQAVVDNEQEVVRKMSKFLPKTDLTMKVAEENLRELALEGNVIGMHRLIEATGVDVNCQEENDDDDDDDDGKKDDAAKENAGNYGDTPLFYAMEGGKLDAAVYLINHGADIKAIGDGRETLLHCAAMQDLGLVKYLVEHGLDVNAKNKAGVTPLHHAICRNRLDIAAYLLEHGADIQMAAANETPLPVCVSMFGTVETLKFLAEKGVDFKAKTKEGFTAMHAAVALNPAVVPYLRTLGLPELSEEEVKRAKKKYISNMMPEIIHCGHVWCHQDIRYRW